MPRRMFAAPERPAPIRAGAETPWSPLAPKGPAAKARPRGRTPRWWCHTWQRAPRPAPALCRRIWQYPPSSGSPAPPWCPSLDGTASPGLKWCRGPPGPARRRARPAPAALAPWPARPQWRHGAFARRKARTGFGTAWRPPAHKTLPRAARAGSLPLPKGPYSRGQRRCLCTPSLQTADIPGTETQAPPESGSGGCPWGLAKCPRRQYTPCPVWAG